MCREWDISPRYRISTIHCRPPDNLQIISVFSFLEIEKLTLQSRPRSRLPKTKVATDYRLELTPLHSRPPSSDPLIDSSGQIDINYLIAFKVRYKHDDGPRQTANFRKHIIRSLWRLLLLNSPSKPATRNHAARRNTHLPGRRGPEFHGISE